ncbi:hypothetical protein OQB17_004441 [Salmonella enterica]|nr:hypothetical protein [Salmonella enterica]
MQIIKKSELPENYANKVLIKRRERNYHYQHMVAIEKTLEYCRGIRLAFEAELAEERQRSQQDGFSAGFEIFLVQFIKIISLYNKRQEKTFNAYKNILKKQVKNLLFDSEVAELLISKMQGKVESNKDFIFIFPKEFCSIFNGELNCLYTDGGDITLKNNGGIIRFSYDTACEEMFETTELYFREVVDKLNQYFYDEIDSIINLLQELKKNCPR